MSELLCDYCETNEATHECGKCHVQVYCSTNCQKLDFAEHQADCHDIDYVCLDTLKEHLNDDPDQPLAQEIIAGIDNDDFHAIQAGVCLIGWKPGQKRPILGGHRKNATKKKSKLFKKAKSKKKTRKSRRSKVPLKTKAKAAAAGAAGLLLMK